MSAPLVTLVVPMLDASPTIEQCLASCLALDWPDLEIIVVDNGSTDDSRERVAAVARSSRCPVLLLECDERGPGLARNWAYAHIRGDFVAWVDADDAPFASKLKEQVAVLQPFMGTPAIASSDVLVEESR